MLDMFLHHTKNTGYNAKTTGWQNCEGCILRNLFLTFLPKTENKQLEYSSVNTFPLKILGSQQGKLLRKQKHLYYQIMTFSLSWKIGFYSSFKKLTDWTGQVASS